MKKEIWIPIKETNNVFAISNFGRVKRIQESLRKGFSKVGKILSPGKDRMGYAVFVLTFNKQRITRTGHTLVAYAFLGERKHKQQVNHKDGNKFNNHIKNLEYVTQIENMAHARNILHKKYGNFKLTKENVIDIRNEKFSLSILAEKYHVTPQCIHRIKNFKTWTNI